MCPTAVDASAESALMPARVGREGRGAVSKTFRYIHERSAGPMKQALVTSTHMPPRTDCNTCHAMPWPAAPTRSMGLGPVSMSSRLRESDDKGGKKAGGSHWKPGDYKQRSSEAIVGEVGHPRRTRAC